VTAARKRPGDRHRRDPIAFRPPADDGEWLVQHAEEIGKPVNRVLSELVAAYRAEVSVPADANSLGWSCDEAMRAAALQERATGEPERP
jgi:hypothetical protein